MISLDNKNRLIGDFFEANSAIIYEESTNTKTPKLLVKYRAKRQRKKLISIINNLCSSDYTLTRDNVYELFVYLFNNADIFKKDEIKIYKPDDGIVDDRIEGVIVLDNIMCLMHIDHNSDYIEITIQTKTSNTESSKIEINRKEVADKSGIANETLKKINKFLLEIIREFLIFNISRFNNTEEE